MMASFGFALIASWRTKVPLLLDIDDWEIGLYGSFGSKVRSAVRFWKLDGYLLAVVMDRLARHRQNVTVSNSFLLARYGGVLVPHFRDTSQFDPNRYDQEEEKGRLGLKGRHVILFLGTPRPHKGLLELIEAVGQLRRDDLVLLLVGAGEGDCKALPEKSFLRIIGRQPFHTVPRFLAAADLIVLFQSNSSAARGQLPAKLFDAMSMAKPIIASAVSDLPDILDNCGEVTVPGDVDGLVERIQTLLDNPDYAHELGARAREKCVAHYSFVAVAPRVHAVIEEMLDSSHPTEKLSRRARASSVVLARCRRELRKDGG
jgi:glycosyltransferase involved in cell wall biosynthesis